NRPGRTVLPLECADATLARLHRATSREPLRPSSRRAAYLQLRRSADMGHAFRHLPQSACMEREVRIWEQGTPSRSNACRRRCERNRTCSGEVMNKAAAFLLAVGLLQMTGDLIERSVSEPVGRALKGVGAATTASPAPKVFSSVRGLETYSTRFYLEWTDRDGSGHSLPVTPEVYARLRGPYNRRNVYGAALAYGPVLPPELRDPVMRYALCGDPPLLRELGVDPAEIRGPVRVRFEPLPGTDAGNLQLMLEAPCP